MTKLEPIRIKYKFTFLIDRFDFNYSEIEQFHSFNELSSEKLSGNRKTPRKTGILLDYFYRQRIPNSYMLESDVIKAGFIRKLNWATDHDLTVILGSSKLS